MQWSISDARIFRKCQRQWFYRRCLASPKAKDPRRREAWILSKLNTISAWRGQIVDKVLEELVVSALINRRSFSLDRAKARARELFDSQLAFARRHGVRDPGLQSSKVGNVFAAFYNVEYGLPFPEEELAQAWEDIRLALVNAQTFLRQLSTWKGVWGVRPQCRLTIEHSGTSVRATPDLIVFFEKEPPLIVDWKVHSFGAHDYFLQLATYAIVLHRVKPHSNFPPGPHRWAAHDIQIKEAQLLTNQLRDYPMNSADIASVDTFIAGSITAMTYAVDGRPLDELSADEFEPTRDVHHCDTCPYKKICWEQEL